MCRVVFDTVILVRALINPVGLWGRLVFDRAEQYELVISAAIVREALEVLQRPNIVSRARGDRQTSFTRLAHILNAATSVDVTEVPAVSRDPKDDVFLATARAAAADYLVSEDQDLLVLGAHHGTEIMTAAAFLRILDAERQT